jgi:phosphotransferase system enzyme I (PtsP)
MEERLSDVASLIFSAHLLMLKDEAFSGEMVRRIEGGEPVQAAILDVVQQYTDLFSASSNPMLREKTQDVKDLGHRLLHNLYPTSNDPVDYSGQIVIAEELLPSDLVKLAAQGAGGVVLTGGSLTAHIAILARSIQLPLVLASEKSLLNLAEGTPILLDAEQGSIFINPKAEVIKNFHESAETARAGR